MNVTPMSIGSRLSSCPFSSFFPSLLSFLILFFPFFRFFFSLSLSTHSFCFSSNSLSSSYFVHCLLFLLSICFSLPFFFFSLPLFFLLPFLRPFSLLFFISVNFSSSFFLPENGREKRRKEKEKKVKEKKGK